MPAFRLVLASHSIVRRRLLCGVAAALTLLPGCGKTSKTAPSVGEPPTVQIVQPETRTIRRIVGQPSFVESYERTSIYSKVTGFIEKWNVDIGKRVKKGDVLATIYVPELREDFETKKATVKLDQERVTLAEKLVKVAEADVQAADARVTEAKSILGQYDAQVLRWDTEVKRLTKEVKAGVVDAQVLLESENQLRASTAQRNAARATISKSEAELLAKKAGLAQELVNVEVAKLRVTVSESDAKRLAAWVSYLTLTSPYDGVVVARNVNTGDFVMPLTGDPTADTRAPYLSPSGRAAPLYVIDRTDVVRVFVDVPEDDADYVKGASELNKQDGNKALVRIKAYRDIVIPATVTRTAVALNVKSRTLRAEIDLRNADLKMYVDKGDHQIADSKELPKKDILPGMYAYGKIVIERPNVRALPLTALQRVGDRAYYWRYEDGKAVRAEVQTGVNDGEWIEITSREVAGKPGDWTALEDSEQVILGDFTVLTDGGPVIRAATTKGEKKTE